MRRFQRGRTFIPCKDAHLPKLHSFSPPPQHSSSPSTSFIKTCFLLHYTFKHNSLSASITRQPFLFKINKLFSCNSHSLSKEHSFPDTELQEDVLLLLVSIFPLTIIFLRYFLNTLFFCITSCRLPRCMNIFSNAFLFYCFFVSSFHLSLTAHKNDKLLEFL